MKKLICLLCMSLLNFAVGFSQTESEHLIFKGVPIDGSLECYVRKMEDAGFSPVETAENHVVMLKGDFAGFNGCRVSVVTTEGVDVVSSVCVVFSEQEDWKALLSRYNYLKGMLTEKYGEPSSCVEELPDGDTSSILYWVRVDKCTWGTTYVLPQGTIQLFIENYGSDCHVMLRYVDKDKANSDLVRAKAMEDL